MKLACISLTFCLASADKSSVEQGDCLLAARAQLSRQQVSIHHHKENRHSASRHHSWSAKHDRLFKVANETTDALDRFIKAQAESDDQCSARLMESKRTLDGLLKDLKSITEQVESHEEVLSTEIENLNITHNAIDAVESTFGDEKAECEKQKQEAQGDQQRFNGELEELNQIANPAVQYTHVVNVSIPPINTVSEPINTALLEEGSWTSKQCHKFISFAQKSSVIGVAAQAKNLTCDEQRAELQKVFTETYIAVRGLIDDAEERVEDKECIESAEAKKTSELVPLVGQRESASGTIEHSTQALAMLEPIFQMLTRRVEKLEKHINHTLTPECLEAANVTSTIKVIRDLIISLEKCPGRNDFKLQIPPENKTTTSTNAPAPGLLQMNNSGFVKDAMKVRPVSRASVAADGDAQLKPKFVNDTKSQTDPRKLIASHHEESHEAKEKQLKRGSAETQSMQQKEEESNYESDDDDNNDNESTNDEEEDYDEFQTRVERKSTPNGTVTTYTEEKIK